MSATSAEQLLQALAAEPWRYDFFHALRLVEAAHPRAPRLGTARRPQDEPVRLGQSPDLSFAPATLHAVRPRTGSRPPRIDVRFLGLFGPNGPLPLHLTEYARERELHHGDETFARFADLFHHRVLLLFYRAWAQAQPAVGMDRPDEDRFAAFVGSLIGIGSPAMRRRDAVHDHVKLHFAGVFTRQSRSAEGLAALLGGMLRRPVQVEQFAGAWMPLQPAERSRLGTRRSGARRNTSAKLGAGAVLGAMVWDRQHHFLVHIGPLDHAAFAALLPGGRVLPAVVALVRQYVGDEFGWGLRLGLQAEQIQPARLGRHGRLGWDSWLRQPGRTGIAPLRLQPIEALRSLRRRQHTESHRSTTDSIEV
ncbi:type VI secretion system baseplate subunit TssG [Aquincola tertiaricarbonis]|uniref:type VI secretion system baseplate subunit TssG n=1 Tax=Aquincola tertiaricarbonis TaxID=391953 RepID=UPI000614CCE5|nr:type VI secretion system baseplate subunit TssG [Aquincola tertiaricarbonis]